MKLLACESKALAGVNQTSVKHLFKMKSRTLITKQAERKLSPEIVETIVLARKNKKWLEAAGVLAGPRRKKLSLNLDEIERKIEQEKIKENVVVVPGKVLGDGELKKKITLVALSFSKSAEEKLKKSKTDFLAIKEEIKKNPEAKGVRVLK